MAPLPKHKRINNIFLTSAVLYGLFLIQSPTTSNGLKPPPPSIALHPHRTETPPPTTFTKTKREKRRVLVPNLSSSSFLSSLSSRGGDIDGAATGATIASSIFNLVNNVAGAGILTLAAGKAKGTGWIPSIALCTILGAISAYTFAIIGKACETTGEKDFKGLWSRTIGPNTTYIVDSMIAILCIACAIIYSGILGDVFTPLLASAGVPSHLNHRTSNILLLTVFILFPLALIKNLSALAFTSLLGFAAIAYTVFFIIYRALDGSYSLTGGRFLAVGENGSPAITLPSFTKSTMWNFDFSSLVLASNLGLAYIAHYNAPIFYRELRNPTSARFTTMVSLSFVVLTALYIVTMSAGYATFGDVSQGNILLNYHPGDVLSTLGRVATGFSILFGFPLVICGARESLAGVVSSLSQGVDLGKHHVALVTGILAFVTAISVAVKDVSLVVGLTGAVMGSFIVYICPGLIYSRIEGTSKLNMALIPFGLFIGGLGVFMTLKEAGMLG